VSFAQEQFLGEGAAFRQRRFQMLRDGGAQFTLPPGMKLAELVELSRQGVRVNETGGRTGGRFAGREHD
jgi:hypothetical protein